MKAITKNKGISFIELVITIMIIILIVGVIVAIFVEGNEKMNNTYNLEQNYSTNEIG